MTIKDLQAEYQSLVKQARDEKAKYDDGDVPAEARSKIDALLDAAMAKKDELETAVKAAEDARRWADLEAFDRESAGRLPGMGEPGDAPTGVASVQYKDRAGAMRVYTPTGARGWSAAQEAEYTGAFRAALAGEQLDSKGRDLLESKALSAGVDAAGGFLVPSEVFMSELVQAIGNETLMRQIGRVLPTLSTGASIAVPAADSELDAAEWTVESGTGTADTATPFAARRLSPHPLVKLVKVSNTLLRTAAVNVEAWVRDQIAYKFAIAEESAFMVGTGAGQPEGVFTTTNATAVAADVTAASATDIAWADLKAVEFALKAQYRRGASWIVHRTILKELHLLTDSTGRPLLVNDPAGPSRFNLLGYPVYESEYAPSSSASGLYVLALGDWRRCYWIVDSLNFQLQRLVELYAASNQVGYMARREVDGMVVDGNGLIRLKMA